MPTDLISRRASHGALVAALALIFALGLTPLAAQAQTYTVLHKFDTSGPYEFTGGRLAQGRDGNFYAESDYGGTSGEGAIFKLTPSGKLTVLHSFNGSTDGGEGTGGLTLGADGNFYGNTSLGGTGDGGTTFKVTPSGTFTVLESFTEGSGSGYEPQYALVLGSDGDLYGTTIGGTEGVSIVYRITPSGVFSTIASLGEGTGYPGGQPSLGSDGNIYVGTAGGGAYSDSTDFKVTPDGVLTVLHNFDGTDGLFALGGMVQGPNGMFYGAAGGGGSDDAGTIYSLTSSGDFTLLYSLNKYTDGDSPFPQIILGSDGNLYGVAFAGGLNECGTIFKVTPAGAFTVLYNFDGTEACEPEEPLAQGTNGLLYGLVERGAARNADYEFYSLDAGLPPFAGLVSPAGKVGGMLGILGQGFNSSSVVTFGGGIQSTSITLEGSTFISAVITAGAVTGKVSVTTGSTTLTSIQDFRVLP
jgi:uncharacterized repeat protein (TIGR03803 family)